MNNNIVTCILPDRSWFNRALEKVPYNFRINFMYADKNPKQCKKLAEHYGASMLPFVLVSIGGKEYPIYREACENPINEIPFTIKMYS